VDVSEEFDESISVCFSIIWIAAPIGAQCYQTLDITFRLHSTASAILVKPLPHANAKKLDIIAVGDSVV